MSSDNRAERRRQERAAVKYPAEVDGLRLVQATDDGSCLRAAVASVLGLDLADVPTACNGSDHDPAPVHQAWHAWAAERGLAIHDDYMLAPVFLPAWIAMVEVASGELHALVMSYDRLLYDPATPPGSPQGFINADHVLMALIVGTPEWVAEQATQMQIYANTDPSRVWVIGPMRAFMNQMQQEGTK